MFNANRNVSQEDPAVPPTPYGETKTTKKSGAKSKQRRTDDFRRKVGAKQLQERRNEVMKRLGIFDQSCADLEKSLLEMQVTIQPKAIPLAVATRGVGFAVAVEYSRMCTTWNLAAIIEICTIHQYYRVSMYLVYYKLYLARYEQSEMASFDAVAPFVLDEEVRQVIAPVNQVPISTSNILASIGRVDGPCVWHSVPNQSPLETAEQMALYLYPTTIRGVLNQMSDPDFDAVIRDEFHSLNPIPGANWVLENGHWILINADQIWPVGYRADELQGDVHAYCNVLTRVSGRLPPSFISSFTWNGQASKSSLVSMDPVPLSLTSTFIRAPRPTRNVRRRDACGNAIERQAVADEAVYNGDVVTNRAFVSHVWSPDESITALEMIVGSAAMVGEHSGIPTRLQIQGRKDAHISPGTVLYRLVDAPRSRPP